MLYFIFGGAVPLRPQPKRTPMALGYSWCHSCDLSLLVGSALFSFYVTHFATYNVTYGSLGVVVILMIWFFLSVYSILLGAEINAEMERQTVKDTTAGKPKPTGDRGAWVADTVGA